MNPLGTGRRSFGFCGALFGNHCYIALIWKYVT